MGMVGMSIIVSSVLPCSGIMKNGDTIRKIRERPEIIRIPFITFSAILFSISPKFFAT